MLDENLCNIFNQIQNEIMFQISGEKIMKILYFISTEYKIYEIQ